MRSASLFCCLVTLAIIACGCSGSRVIEVRPPSSATSGQHTNSGARGTVNVLLQSSAEDLMPSGVVSTRFRVTEISFKQVGGGWVQRLSNREAVSAAAARRTTFPLLSTELAAVPFDSIAVHLGDVFITYNASAGGPLVPESLPVTLPINLLPDPTEAATIVLRYHPTESVRLDSTAYVWRFMPTFTVVEE